MKSAHGFFPRRTPKTGVPALDIGLLLATFAVAGEPSFLTPAHAATPCDAPVACENTLPGSPASEWEVAGAGDSPRRSDNGLLLPPARSIRHARPVINDEHLAPALASLPASFGFTRAQTVLADPLTPPPATPNPPVLGLADLRRAPVPTNTHTTEIRPIQMPGRQVPMARTRASPDEISTRPRALNPDRIEQNMKRTLNAC